MGGAKVRTNTIYCGDCLFVLQHDFPANSVDLIYLDPPFFTGQIQGNTWTPEAMEVSFEDSKKFWSSKRYAGAPEWLKHIGVTRPAFASYIYYMQRRLEECARVLRNTGSIYLHCDSHASHYLKILMDEIFGERLVNEIVWQRTSAHTGEGKVKRMGIVHDTILFYAKGDDYTFNPQYVPLDPKYVNKFYRFKDEDGRPYRISDLTAPEVRHGETGKVWRGIDVSSRGRHWMRPVSELEELAKQGRIHFPKKKGGVPAYKRYLDEIRGQLIQDIWTDIRPIQSQSKERLGYPTQKPEALLERIVKTSSNKDDVVLDPFCGCGTTIASAHRLGRRWIGIDISPVACELMQKRMENQLGVRPHIVQRNLDGVMKLGSARFEDWVNNFYNATKAKPDVGVDGITQNGIPIQTKAYEKPISYDIVDGFLTSAKYHPQVPKPIKKMILVSKTGFDEKARSRVFEIEQKEGIVIQLVEPKDLLEETR